MRACVCVWRSFPLINVFREFGSYLDRVVISILFQDGLSVNWKIVCTFFNMIFLFLQLHGVEAASHVTMCYCRTRPTTFFCFTLVGRTSFIFIKKMNVQVVVSYNSVKEKLYVLTRARTFMKFIPQLFQNNCYLEKKMELLSSLYWFNKTSFN